MNPISAKKPKSNNRLFTQLKLRSLPAATSAPSAFSRSIFDSNSQLFRTEKEEEEEEGTPLDIPQLIKALELIMTMMMVLKNLPINRPSIMS
jgi:hypothetical protein